MVANGMRAVRQWLSCLAALHPGLSGTSGVDMGHLDLKNLLLGGSGVRPC